MKPIPEQKDSQRAEKKFAGKVLVVEDDSINQKLISHILDSFGVEIELASDGEAGLELGQNKELDLIFMDMQLPKLDGTSVVRELKAKNIKTPIVALTASQNKADINGLLEAGCTEWVSKPFNRGELSDCLKRYLRSKDAKEEKRDEFPKGERYAEIISGYVDRLGVRLESIETHLAEEDWSALREESHRLVGAGLFGFPQVSLVAKLIEQNALNSDSKGCRELVKRLRTQIQSAQQQKESSESS